MLKKLILKNIQSHKKTIIKFSPGLNVIIGLTGSGKTALKRGLCWSIFNQPEGKEFKEEIISKWADTASSTLIFDNHKIKRVRNRTSKNYYELDNRKLNAVGRNVPDEIKEAINLNEINIQDHTEPFFILKMSPIERAKYLNKITNLESIDESLSSVRKEKLQTERKIKETESQLKEKRKKIKSYSWIDKVSGKLDILIEESKQINSLSKTITRMTDLKDRLIELKSRRRKIKFDPEVKNKIDQLLEEQILLNKEEKSIKKTEQIITTLKDKKSQLKILRKTLKKYIDKYKTQMPDICLLCGAKVKNKNLLNLDKI